jgi:hypothetical protein
MKAAYIRQNRCNHHVRRLDHAISTLEHAVGRLKFSKECNQDEGIRERGLDGHPLLQQSADSCASCQGAHGDADGSVQLSGQHALDMRPTCASGTGMLEELVRRALRLSQAVDAVLGMSGTDGQVAEHDDMPAPDLPSC